MGVFRAGSLDSARLKPGAALIHSLGNAEQGVPGWEIAYRTNPDHQLLRLVPGLGIRGFTYEHHGTVASATARLVRYVPGRR
jgi:hypothetical protein